VALAVLCLALAGGCGSEEAPSTELPDALGYAPKDAFAVVLVPTDFEGEQLRRLGHLVGPWLRENGAESLRSVVMDDADFGRQIDPLLGGTLVLTAYGDPDDPAVVAALDTPDAEKAQALADKMEDVDMRADGSTLVIGLNHGAGAIRDAIARKQAGDGMTAAAFADAFGPGADDDALVRVLGDAKTLARELDVDVDVPWIQALRWASAGLRLDDDEIDAHARLSTDPDGLSEDDLPLATGDDPPEAGDLDGRISAANRDQSRTTVFLATLARKAYPNSTFVREVEKLEADLGISFEDEVLAQFNGPSASIATPDGDFAAVSDVADPDAMRALLPKLAPRLPSILRGLRGLGNTGLVALLLMAPDAPLVPGALRALGGGIEVRPVAREPDLYEITGLDTERLGEPEFAVPSVVFGMIGDRFVVATTLGEARRVADMDVSEVDGARGAAVLRTDLGSWARDQLERAFGVKTLPMREVTGLLQASLDGIEGRLRVEIPDGLD
jgi:hypothetical protein